MPTPVRPTPLPEGVRPADIDRLAERPFWARTLRWTGTRMRLRQGRAGTRWQVVVIEHPSYDFPTVVRVDLDHDPGTNRLLATARIRPGTHVGLPATVAVAFVATTCVVLASDAQSPAWVWLLPVAGLFLFGGTAWHNTATRVADEERLGAEAITVLLDRLTGAGRDHHHGEESAAASEGLLP